MKRVVVRSVIAVVIGLILVFTQFSQTDRNVNENVTISYSPALNNVGEDTSLSRDRGNVWTVQTVDPATKVGSFAEIAVDGLDRPHIAYFDKGNYDLKYAFWNGSSWERGTVDSGGYVGRNLSIALDHDNRPHISYADVTNYDLKYAYFDGNNWTNETVDQQGFVGGHTSIAVDSLGRPHISYHARGEIGAIDERLKYAYFDGDRWYDQTLDSRGVVGWSTSIAVDSHDRPHISYSDITNNVLRFAYFDGEAWSNESVDTQHRYYGKGTSLGLDSEDLPHIGYYDGYPDNDLKYAHYDGEAWRNESVDSQGDVSWGVSVAVDKNDRTHMSYGRNDPRSLNYSVHDGNDWTKESVVYGGRPIPGSLGLDKNDTPHICYIDNGTLKYAVSEADNIGPVADAGADQTARPGRAVIFDGSMSSDDKGIVNYTWNFSYDGSPITLYGVAPFFVFETEGNYYVNLTVWDGDGNLSIDTMIVRVERTEAWDVSTIDGEGHDRNGTSLAVDSEGQPCVSYCYYGVGLKYAVYNGDGWDIEYIMNQSQSYNYNPDGHLALDDENRPHIAYYDEREGDLILTYFNGKEWDHEKVDTKGDVGRDPSIALDSRGAPHISYYEGEEKNLKYARYDEGSWMIKTLEVGIYTSIKLDSQDRPHISYYNPSQDTLRYAHYDGDTWNLETVDPGVHIGRYTTIAIDRNDQPHISYSHGDALKYAYYDGNDWKTQVLDDTQRRYGGISLVLDPNDRPHIAYYGESAYYSESEAVIKHTYWNGVLWLNETVDSNIRGDDLSMGMNSSGALFIAYYHYGELKFAKKDNLRKAASGFPVADAGEDKSIIVGETVRFDAGESFDHREIVNYTWSFRYNDTLITLYGVRPSFTFSREGTYDISLKIRNDAGNISSDMIYVKVEEKYKWRFQTVDPEVDAVWYTSLAVDSDGNPHICYGSDRNGQVKYAYHDGEYWYVEIIASAKSRFYEIELDSKDRPHIFFIEEVGHNNSQVRYLHRDGNGWLSSIVDSSEYFTGDLVLEMDKNDNPHIGYTTGGSEVFLGDLNYAHYDGKEWEIETLDTFRRSSRIYSLKLDENSRPHIIYKRPTKRIDNRTTFTDLKHIHFDGEKWIEEIIEENFSKGPRLILTLDKSNILHVGYVEWTGLKYLYFDGNEWSNETIVTPSNDIYLVGISLDSSGRPHLCYIRSDKERLVYTYFDGDEWKEQKVMSLPRNSAISFTLDAYDRPHLSYYDRWRGRLRYGTLSDNNPIPTENRYNIRLGPVVDKNDRVLEEVEIHFTYDGRNYSGRTNKRGLAEINGFPIQNIPNGTRLFGNYKGHEISWEYGEPLVIEGDEFSSGDEKAGSYRMVVLWGVFLVILIIIAFLLVYLLKTRTKPRRPSGDDPGRVEKPKDPPEER